MTLFDKDTRKGAALLASKSRDKLSFYKEHPAKCIADLRYEYEQLSSSIMHGMDTTIQTLTKVEELIEQVEDEKKVN